MARKLALVAGIPRMRDEFALPDIYDEELSVVSGTPGAGEINVVTAGNPVTLPNSGTYEGSELEVNLNGQIMLDGLDYSYVGSAPRTQITFTFDLAVGDIVNFRKTRDL